jgi:SAM-dependent methyltransferase
MSTNHMLPLNEQARERWLEKVLTDAPAGQTIIDVGAGECHYKQYCNHLEYTSQDIAQYDGIGNQKGLHTKQVNYEKLDIISDLYDIPEDTQYDIVLCVEVLEHVVDPARAIHKLCSLVSPGGSIILTAPFCSLTHYAPHFHATGFSEYFYRHHFAENNCSIETLNANGGFFDFMDQELERIPEVVSRYNGYKIGRLDKHILKWARWSVQRLARKDGDRMKRTSEELLTFGWHVKAVKNN